MQTSAPQAGRIEIIDVARGVALAAMAIYHFAWDLEFFGYAEPGMTAVGGWKLFARGIASSFLFLVGVSLYLGHARIIRWPGFLRRLAMVAGAAAAITVATWIATPHAFIFFGILHQIALASVLGLAFLRLPALLTIAAAAFFIAGRYFFRSELFDHPALLWLGLAPLDPRSNDYVPLFPWFAAVLLGIAAARLADRAGLFVRLRALVPPRTLAPAGFAGRHSLAVYLIHQPVLIGGLWLFAQIFPASEPPRETYFLQACESQCAAERSGSFCRTYCGCMLDGLTAADRLDMVFSADPAVAATPWLRDLADRCVFETELEMEEEGR